MSDLLPSWREGATKQSIVEFVDAVTDPNSEAFVPEVERIAVFDNDGTLSTEIPYAQLAFMLDRAAQLGKPTSSEQLKAGGLPALLDLVRLTHGGITTDDFNTAVRTWLTTARHPRFGRSYAAMVYQPMIELLSLLQTSGFACWVFSGGGADFMRGVGSRRVWDPAPSDHWQYGLGRVPDRRVGPRTGQGFRPGRVR